MNQYHLKEWKLTFLMFELKEEGKIKFDKNKENKIKKETKIDNK
jgi:hypothetical protein